MNTSIFKKHIPCKKFGQNFLIDINVIHDLVKLINPQKKDLLLEIGPGLGALTQPICDLVDKLLVVEVDRNLSNSLKNRSFYSKLTIFCHDALTFNYSNLFFKKKFVFLGIYHITYLHLCLWYYLKKLILFKICLLCYKKKLHSD